VFGAFAKPRALDCQLLLQLVSHYFILFMGIYAEGSGIRGVLEFVPLLKEFFLGQYFKLCVIDLDNLSMKEIGDKEVLILLKEVNEDTIFLF
jgi:hypothetical protein